VRFELLANHILVIGGISRLVEAGTVIDADEVTGFAATPLMRALDADSLAVLILECQRIRRAARGGALNIAGYGHADQWSRPER
jgi:hypothetical protein